MYVQHKRVGTELLSQGDPGSIEKAKLLHVMCKGKVNIKATEQYGKVYTPCLQQENVGNKIGKWFYYDRR